MYGVPEECVVYGFERGLEWRVLCELWFIKLLFSSSKTTKMIDFIQPFDLGLDNTVAISLVLLSIFNDVKKEKSNFCTLDEMLLTNLCVKFLIISIRQINNKFNISLFLLQSKFCNKLVMKLIVLSFINSTGAIQQCKA